MLSESRIFALKPAEEGARDRSSSEARGRQRWAGSEMHLLYRTIHWEEFWVGY